jgi:chaperonin GroEL
VGRHALLIAAGEYQDQTLARLRAPAQDVGRLAAILEDPEVGGFTSVTVLQDVPDYRLRMAIEEVLTDRLGDDLALVYFSCHGIVDRQHRLYFATTNTRQARPASTAVSGTFVNEQLEACGASAKVLILDCCYSGAFAEGFKSAPRSALEGQVGRGYVVLAASDAYEYAYEADSVTDAAPRASVFTDVLIGGLSSGEADLDADGRIGADELFRYIQEGVRRRSPNQKPRFWANDAELNIYLAKAGQSRRAATPVSAAGPARVTGPGNADAPARPSNYNRNQVIVARGLRSASNQVRHMLGPMGRHVVVEDENGDLTEVADARTFTAAYRPEDPRDRLGASYAAEIVRYVHGQAGDGAATAVVLAQAMVEGAAAALRAGANPMALASGVEAGVALAVEALARQARDVETKEQLAAFAAAAARDHNTGEIIAEAMDKVGKEGVITVEESHTFGLELELTEGMRFNKGYIAPYFVTDPERLEAVLDDPYILLVLPKISANKDLLPILEKVMPSGKPLVIIAEDVEGEALATLVVNKTREVLKSVAVKAPGFGDRRRAMLADIAVLTGAQVISEGSGLTLDGADLYVLGRARKVVVTKDETTIVDGAGDGDQIMGRVNQIRTEIDNSDSDYDREKLQERLAKLAGGVAVIKVGAATEAEVEATKARYERAIRATRAAVNEGGLLPGGGTSLCTAGEIIAASGDSGDRGIGIKVVAESLSAPYAQVLANAGIPVPVPAGSGIDVLSGGPADLFSAGIFDSCRALSAALEAAKQATIRFLKVALPRQSTGHDRPPARGRAGCWRRRDDERGGNEDAGFDDRATGGGQGDAGRADRRALRHRAHRDRGAAARSRGPADQPGPGRTGVPRPR